MDEQKEVVQRTYRVLEELLRQIKKLELTEETKKHIETIEHELRTLYLAIDNLLKLGE